MVPILGSSVDNSVLRADGIGGNLIQGSNVIIDDAGKISPYGICFPIDAVGVTINQTSKTTSGSASYLYLKAQDTNYSGANAGWLYICGGTNTHVSSGVGGSVSIQPGHGATTHGSILMYDAGGTAMLSITSVAVTLGEQLVLRSYSRTQALGIFSPTNGAIIFVSDITPAQPAYYSSGWKKITDGTAI